MGRWRKSSYSDTSGGNCLEVASWHTSRYTDGGLGQNCVEVAEGRVAAIRDTWYREHGFLEFPASEFVSLVNAVRQESL
ncbi:DUF397 domain-containing protein [Nocardiopsis rhodophaea]|uniref:DUF397 domain-containing protein n=1 Tax=Nocardiopsis rhodophaea TaxID=280238 RepID=A0ABP5ER45_9ACTN